MTKTIMLQGQVRYSQTINQFQNVSVTLCRETADIQSVKCDCMANKGKCCSHVAGVICTLYELLQGVIRGYTGQACTNTACVWNSGTSQNVLPDTVENIRSACGSQPKSMVRIPTALETDADVINDFSTGILHDRTLNHTGNHPQPHSFS